MRIHLAVLLVCMLSVLNCMSVNNTEPILEINTEMHTSRILKISTDAHDKTLLTCSDDKTARIWDLSNGKLLRILRPPIDNGHNGMLYAGALSPDGKIAVIGGYTLDEKGTSYCFYIFDAAIGTMLKSINGLPQAITEIRFSPDGAHLAVGLKASGMRIYTSGDWHLYAEMKDYAQQVNCIAFARDGRMAAASEDCRIRLYDREYKLLKDRDMSDQSAPYRISFSPDGKKIAVGFSQQSQIQVLGANKLNTLYKPDVRETGDLNNILNTVCFSSDGKKLIAGGTYKDSSKSVRIIRVWQKAGKGKWSDHHVAKNTILDLIPLPDGGLLFGGPYPEWGRLSKNYDDLKLYKAADIYTFGYAYQSLLKVNQDGSEVGFKPWGSEPQWLSVNDRLLQPGKTTFPAYVDSVPGIVITDYIDSAYPKLNRSLLDILDNDNREHSLCADIIAAKRRILIGCSYNLYCLDTTGAIVWKSPSQTRISAVKASGNGQIAVTVNRDGTLRWYRLKDGICILKMFVYPDGRKWIIWTDSGYYDCAPGSEDLIGWHVNQGADKEGLFYPVSRFRTMYYRPDLISRILKTLDESEAISQIELVSGLESNPKGVGDILPPTVRITSPGSNASFATEDLTITYSITSPNNEPVTGIKVLIDGRPLFTQIDPVLKDGKGSVAITLPQKEVTIGVLAENRFGSSQVDEVMLHWNGEGFSTLVTTRPDLYALIIGISRYNVESYRLKYSAKDASDFSSSLKKQEGLLYNKVNIRLLTDELATREAILDGLDWLQVNCSRKDIAIIFLSGHGINDNVGLFYYLPVSANISRLKATCIPFSDFENTLSAITGKVIVFADACHSGGIYTDNSAKTPDLTRVMNELSDSEVGAIIFTSCTPSQLSYENDTWKNGAFTKALVEGMNGSADYRNKHKISVKALDLYISDRVRELTTEKQTPTTIVPQSIPDFDIGVVP
jgi:WD40 repeat protein